MSTLYPQSGQNPRLLIKFIDRLLPTDIKSSRSDRDLARTFVFTHLFGPLIAQPMWLYLYISSPQIVVPVIVLALGTAGFWLLPLLLRLTGTLWLATLLSFQGLATLSLYASYHYGGLSSPFLPWLVVSLLIGIFYHARNIGLILAILAIDLLIFLGFVWNRPVDNPITTNQLEVLGWLSMGSAMIYMTWMALYYSAIVSLRSELEAEAQQSRIISGELEVARIVAEEKNRARTRFFSKMSHELRTPLHTIIGLSELLLEDIKDGAGSNGARAEDVRLINAAGKHLLSLVAEVLDTDAMKSEATELHPSTFTLGALCDEVLANALPLVEANGNRFTLLCPDPTIVVHTDAKKLRQVLINLLSNAGKFCSDGEVTLELHFEMRQHDDQLRIVVRDTGVGISQAAQERLFTPYERGDALIAARIGGTGLGLALSREICILLGGRISVESREGHGSAFTITVPASINSDTETVNDLETIGQFEK